MNRQIKFRGWCKTPEGAWTASYSGEMPDIGFWKWVAYDSNTPVEQFTGLLDRNGKEIYEGDILQHDLWGKASVIYDPLRAGFSCQRRGETTEDIFDVSLSNIQLKRTRVIGNIHENPDLLTP